MHSHRTYKLKVSRRNTSHSRPAPVPRTPLPSQSVTTTGSGTSARIPVLTPSFPGGFERKYFTTALTSKFRSVATTPNGLDLATGIVQGDDFSQRTGRMVRLTKVHLVGQLVGGQANTVADESDNCFRIMLVQTAAGASPASAFTISVPPDSRQLSCQRVVYDEMFTLTSPGRDSVGYLPASTMVNLHLPVSQEIIFVGGGAASQAGLSLQLWMVSDSAAVPNPGFTSGFLAMEFEDL